MKKNKQKKPISYIVSALLALSLLTGNLIYAQASETNELPAPIKVIDFSYSFDELSATDENFQVKKNEAEPSLIYDNKMGQVLKLGKVVYKDLVFDDDTLISYTPEYSTIEITNPYIGMEHLKEYKDYEDVKTTFYGEYEQPQWSQGISISYWIKTPNAINSNVLGFTSERFAIYDNDYSKYLTTLKFDLEYTQYTEEEKQTLGFGISGVLPDSDFYFALDNEKKYENKNLYIDESRMGSLYWMNKNYEPGYIKKNDGTIIESRSEANYEDYKEAPKFGSTINEHEPGTSNLRYGWIKSEMWLDASSSFYYNGDISPTTQLNPNHNESYNTNIEIQKGNCFNINSWRNSETIEQALENQSAAVSPITNPNEWHNVVVIIQNDWVRYYLDGKEVDVQNTYSSFGGNEIGYYQGGNISWKAFNKGTGSRYGYGVNRDIRNCYYSTYVSTNILDWLILDSTELTIGGGSINGKDFNMYAETDEILIKNIVFFDQILEDSDVSILANNPFMYSKELSSKGDVNQDGNTNATDALLVLEHAAIIRELNEEQILLADINEDKIINATDALEILKIAAKIF